MGHIQQNLDAGINSNSLYSLNWPAKIQKNAAGDKETLQTLIETNLQQVLNPLVVEKKRALAQKVVQNQLPETGAFLQRDSGIPSLDQPSPSFQSTPPEHAQIMKIFDILNDSANKEKLNTGFAADISAPEHAQIMGILNILDDPANKEKLNTGFTAYVSAMPDQYLGQKDISKNNTPAKIASPNSNGNPPTSDNWGSGDLMQRVYALMNEAFAVLGKGLAEQLKHKLEFSIASLHSAIEAADTKENGAKLNLGLSICGSVLSLASDSAGLLHSLDNAPALKTAKGLKEPGMEEEEESAAKAKQSQKENHLNKTETTEEGNTDPQKQAKDDQKKAEKRHETSKKELEKTQQEDAVQDVETKEKNNLEKAKKDESKMEELKKSEKENEERELLRQHKVKTAGYAFDAAKSVAGMFKTGGEYVQVTSNADAEKGVAQAKLDEVFNQNLEGTMSKTLESMKMATDVEQSVSNNENETKKSIMRHNG